MTNTKLCLIEDNQDIADKVVAYMQKKGAQIDHYTQWKEEIASKAPEYACFIIDVMLPGIDGFQIVDKLQTMTDAPTLILTAKGSIQDKEIAFTAGADDYLTKPFQLKELLLRVNALLRRSGVVYHYKWNDIFLDFHAPRALKGDQEVHLAPKEREVLRMLAEHPGIVCSRADLLEVVWGEEDIFTQSRSLDVCIAAIRKKLNKDMIETIINTGYRLAKPNE